MGTPPLVRVLATAAVVLVTWQAKKIISKQQEPFLPPGPPADPIIGHLRLIPSKAQDIFFYELGKTYGQCYDRDKAIDLRQNCQAMSCTSR